MCFQDDANSEMTQIHLWQSYQGTFLPYATSHPHLIAGDFIKNVSTTFSGASAQVAGSNKYVIRGIKPRIIPVDYKNRELVRCQWRSHNPDIVRDYGTVFSHSDGQECGGWFGNGHSLLQHILTTHLRIPRKSQDGITPLDHSDPARPTSSPSNASAYDYTRAPEGPGVVCRCKWSTCHWSKMPASPITFALLAHHIETHLPDTTDAATWKKRHNQLAEVATDLAEKPLVSHLWQRTMVDETNDAAGVPLGCALVLRNIAKAIPRLATAGGASNATAGSGAVKSASVSHLLGTKGDDGVGVEGAKKEVDEEVGPRGLMKKVFGPSKDKLFDAMAHNVVLKTYVGVILQFIAQGGG